MIFSDPSQTEQSDSICYSFGPFQLNPLKRVLTRKGKKQPLPSKVLDTLLVLLENRHRVMDKEELLSKVWGGRLVTENNLNQKIAQLRRVLGESSHHHEYIVTIPGEGYRFVATVKKINCESQDPAPSISLSSSSTVRQTIAIVPFEVMGVSEHDYLGLCLADALITRLSKMELPGLVLAQATSGLGEVTDRAKSSSRRKDLHVGYSVNGRIRKLGERIRINVNLLDAEKGLLIWAEQFDETLTDWLILEDKVAAQIAESLRLKLTREPAGQDTTPTPSVSKLISDPDNPAY